MKNYSKRKILKKLKSIGHSEDLKEIYENNYDEYLHNGLEKLFEKYGNLNDFMLENDLFFNELKAEGYIYIIQSNWLYEIKIPAISQKGIIYLEEYNIIESIAEDYPFLSALIIGLAGGLGATVLNILLN